MIKHFLLPTLLLLAGCYRVPDRLDPRVSSPLQEQHLHALRSAFPPLSAEEKTSDWSAEYRIARAFATDLDLYRAISTFKRTAILLPRSEPARKLEAQYDVLFCYFLGKKYDEAIEEFEKSGLAHVDKTFPAYRDLLLVLYECYRETNQVEKQTRILELMEKSYPETAEKLRLSCAIREGELQEVEQFAQGFNGPSYLRDLLTDYYTRKKSVGRAQLFNTLLPGAGYLYIGQRKSALTAFLLNGLFIAASCEFFLHGHNAAGIITAGFEAGWYFGGIYGAGEEAKYYNERLYEKSAGSTLNDHGLFPVLLLETAF